LTGIAQTAIINTSQQGTDMKSLQAYIDQKNKWQKLFKGPHYEIQTAKGRQVVAACLDSDLSPENLSCDGELPRSQIQAKYRALTAAAKDLQKLDPTVKFYEFA
jgi:hypothetical protein